MLDFWLEFAKLTVRENIKFKFGGFLMSMATANYATVSAPPSTSRKPYNVFDWLNELDNSVNSVGEVAEGLTKQLNPLSASTNNPKVALEKQPDPEIDCDIAQTIYSMILKVRGIRDSLVDTMDRLRV